MARRYLVLVVLLVPLAATAADLKITTVSHYSRVMQNRTDPNAFPDQDWERTETVYVHGRMQRHEFTDEKPAHAGPISGLSHGATIDNCDSRESITLDSQTGEYIRVPWPSDESMRAAAAARVKNQSTDDDWSKLKVVIESKTVDTGETMPFLGYVAHHFVINNHEVPVGELAIRLDKHEDSTVDVWYIDAPVALPNCQPDDPAASAAEEARLRQRREVKHTGPTPHGFLVKMRRVAQISTRTMAYTETLETTVTELSQAPLDATLFTAPPEYKAVKCLRGQPCNEK